MKIRIKDLSINMDLGNNGVTFDVYDTKDSFLGDLRLGKGTIEWCKGRTVAGNGVKVKWSDLIGFFEELENSKVQASMKAKKKPAA